MKSLSRVRLIYTYAHTYAYILCMHFFPTFVPTLKVISGSGECGVQHLNIAALMLLPCSHILFSLCLDTQTCLPLYSPMNCMPPSFSAHGISPGKNTGVGCHFLLEGILLTQESNLRLLHPLHSQVGSLPLASPGKPLFSLYSINLHSVFLCLDILRKQYIQCFLILKSLKI